MISAYERLTAVFGEHVAKLFSPAIFVADDAILFDYASSDATEAVERWEYGLRWQVPVVSLFWIATFGAEGQVRHVFVSHSAVELLSFCRFNISFTRDDGSCCYVALGLLPICSQANELRLRFPRAKFHLIFENSVTGMTADCRFSLWLGGKDATFRLKGDYLHFSYKDTNFRVLQGNFSLASFERLVGVRSGVRTHKSRHHLDWYFTILSKQL